MIEGLYKIEAAMGPKMVRMEVLANNLANLDTVGFKRDRAFSEELTDAEAKQVATQGGQPGIKQAIDFSEGPMIQTNNQFDVAIQGRGFLVADTPNGKRYTRNGNLQLTLDGTIVTSDGYPVEGSSGHLQIPDFQRLQQGAVSIGSTGEIVIGKQSIGSLRVVDFDDYGKLTKDHGSLFEAGPSVNIVDGPGKNTTVRQGFVEGSNVEGIEEMVSMIELSRSF